VWVSRKRGSGECWLDQHPRNKVVQNLFTIHNDINPVEYNGMWKGCDRVFRNRNPQEEKADEKGHDRERKEAMKNYK